MLFHVSVDAEDPKRVAGVIAELWDGVALPFPPVIEGCWVAMAGDDRRTTVEVYPRGTELVEAEGDADGYGVIGVRNPRSATHLAVATNLGIEQVLAIAAREGWPVKYRKRGGIFGVLELWAEGTRMIEVLTPEMQAEYHAGLTVENWQGFLKAVGVVA
ncbi:hypothetical protein [Sphingomonas sp.]|uniref:hypothetical protein n=1 Tax=Sphingomonas sp. TaxID=28214 RepID=UPI001B0CA4F2|nr:hypothetical protein [Sphingomonas sp.]MBO9711395.1 hypothetical protein [Sphingomonas sp.]